MTSDVLVTRQAGDKQWYGLGIYYSRTLAQEAVTDFRIQYVEYKNAKFRYFQIVVDDSGKPTIEGEINLD